MEKITGIILSGGLAKRFQTNNKHWIDKATVEIDGKPMIVRIIKILERITHDIIIVVNNEIRKQSYYRLLQKYEIKLNKICIDEKNNCKGPLLGILTGMKQVETDYCLILPCDIPYIKVPVLLLLIRNLPKHGMTLFIHENGEIEPLPVCISVQKCLEVTKLICKLGKRRIDDIYRGFTEIILIPTWRIRDLDPQFKSFTNINYPNDFKKEAKIQFSGETLANSYPFRTEEKITDFIDEIKENIEKLKPKNIKLFLNIIDELKSKQLYYWIASLYEILGRNNPKFFNDAADFFLKESNFYSTKGLSFLARHAKLDQKWCLKQVGKEF